MKLKQKKKVLFFLWIAFIIISLSQMYFILNIDLEYRDYNNPDNECLEISNGSETELKLEWFQLWGDIYYDLGEGITLDKSGNIYITGYTWIADDSGDSDIHDVPGHKDVILLKFNPSGNLIWQKIWGDENNNGGNELVIDDFGNIYVIGSTDYRQELGNVTYIVGNMVLLKYDTLGNLIWNTSWGGWDEDRGSGIAIDKLGNLYLTGSTYSYSIDGSSDVFLLKYNSSGSLQWNRTWGGSARDIGNNIDIDDFGNIYITGYTWSYGVGSSDICLLKYNSSGILQWNTTWGNTYHDRGYGLIVDNSEIVYITGYSENFKDQYPDICLLKYNSSGILQWNKTWGLKSYYEEGYDVDTDEIGNIYITGYARHFSGGYSDLVLLKYNSSGFLKQEIFWGESNHEYGFGIVVNNSENIYITGYTSSYGIGDSNVCLLKYGINSFSNNLAIQGYNLTFLLFTFNILVPILLLIKKNKKVMK